MNSMPWVRYLSMDFQSSAKCRRRAPRSAAMFLGSGPATQAAFSPICGFLRETQARDLRAQPLDLRNSGDTAGSKTESLATVLGPFQRRYCLSRAQRGRDADLAAIIGKLVSARLSSVIKPSSNDAWWPGRACDRTLSPHRPVSASVRWASSVSWVRDPNAFVPSP